MKKLMTMLVLVAAMSATTGCLTRLGAHTKKTVSPDGTITMESDVTVFGMGDKVAQVAGEGVFADGTEDDLGAGLKKANASQQSTGIDGSLNALDNVLNGIDRLVAARAGIPVKAAAVSDAAEVNAETQRSGDAETDTAPKEEEGDAVYSAEGYGGSPGADGSGVYGRPSCARCRAYRAAHPGIEIVNLDTPEYKAAMWAALKARGYKGTSAALPVEVTAAGYATGKK